MIRIEESNLPRSCNSCNAADIKQVLSVGLYDEGGHTIGIALCNDCLRKLGKIIRELPNE